MPDEKLSYDDSSYVSVDTSLSIHQSDARIFHQPQYRYDEVDAVTAVTTAAHEAQIMLKHTSGVESTMRIRFMSDEAIRLQWSGQGTQSEFEENSEMLVPYPAPAPTLAYTSEGGQHSWKFGERQLIITTEPFAFKIVDAAGKTIFELENYPLAGSPLVGTMGWRKGQHSEPYLSWKIHNDERFFGLGEKWNKVEKKGTRATIWASDTCGSNSNDMSYKSIPYLLSSRGWGMFLHSGFRSFWEVGNFSYVSGSVLSEDDKLDAFLFFGDGFKGLIDTYTSLTGKPQPVPDWALGVWMSRCQYEKQSEAEEAMDGLRERDIPADVIHLDPLWMKTHYYFKIGVDACDFVRNDSAFPDLPSLWKKWKENGFRTCLWVNPYIPEGTPIYDYAKEQGFLLKSDKGGLAKLSHGEPVGMIDFTNPAAKEWWKGKLKELLSDGAAVLKPDYGDRVPEDAIFHNGKTGKELHSRYLFWFTETCYEACQEVYDYGMVWRRSGYIGSQRYPGTWAGDTRSTWEEMASCLRGGLSAGFNGDAFWAGDIGGFTGDEPSPELYIRWAQWGLLTPLARFHGANSPREPWYFGDKAVEVVRNYAKLRYKLLPYYKKCAQEAYQSGTPIMRHMHLEFPSAPATQFIDDQFMIGADLLMAPVFAAGATERSVYLPAGTWQQLDAHLSPMGEPIDGGKYHTVAAPLEIMPLFKKPEASLS